MKVGRCGTNFGIFVLGTLSLVSAAPRQAFGDDRTQTPASQRHHPGDDHDRPGNELVKVVRESTARFRDVSVAEAEGYKLQFGCVTGPDAGAMGLHYVNMSLVGDGKLDATRPDIVIYEPLADGRLRLIGADFLVLADAWDAQNDKPPELMGQLFHLFESPNRFRLPAFYTLHVWAWKDNPTGTFVNWHSDVSCDGFDGQQQALGR